jgi:hypothetical protein
MIGIQGQQDETELTVRWRRDQLVACGVPARMAADLARNPTCDVHQMIDLVERGCRPHLAVRILAPLDEGAA